jgi:uncharacterized protein (TIGR03435 family)
MGIPVATAPLQACRDIRGGYVQQSLGAVKATIRIAAVALILNVPLSQAQAPGKPPEFEVASIKPNKTNERMYYGLRNDRLTVRNMTVKGLIQSAYGKRDFQIAGGPAWITSECFDIDAKAERPQKATHDMEKSLLASRFQLKLHKETKEASVYSLVVARGGLKMKLSADQTEPEKGGPRELGPGLIVGESIPMYIIANLLSNMLGRAVIDNTGLRGKYDAKFTARSRFATIASRPRRPAGPSGCLDFCHHRNC